jgi:phosphopantetheinyl transferase (holo-ACP synthase)
MPICYKIDDENYKLGLWNLTEGETELWEMFVAVAPDNEKLEALKYKNPSRKSEWIASRLLTYELINKVIEIKYDNNRKPFFVNHPYKISISHTRGMVSVIVSKNDAGIDIELISDRVLKIEDRFLSPVEKENISTKERLLPVLINWSAKETIYKIYGKKGVDFKQNIFIEPVLPGLEGHFNGELRIDNKNSLYNLNYFIFEPSNKETAYLVVYHYS